jgi:hypothetical protein
VIENPSNSEQEVSMPWNKNGSRFSSQFRTGLALADGIAVGMLDAMSLGLALGLVVVHTGLHFCGQFSKYAGSESEHLAIVDSSS